MRLSEKIKAYREKNNITQQELADKLFVSRSTVAKWEQGRGLPSNELLEKLSSELNISLEELIDEKELRSLTIDNNNNIKEQKKSTKAIFIILLSVVLILSGIFAIVLYNMNQKVEQEIKYAYCIAEVDGQNIKVASKRPSIDYFEMEISVDDESFFCWDKYGQVCQLSTIQTGYKVYVTYIPSEDGYSNGGKIERMDIVDDFVKGQLLTYGFFLTTEEYTGEEVPIHCPNLGYTWPYSSEPYPFYIIGETIGSLSNQAHTYSDVLTQVDKKKEEYVSKTTGQVQLYKQYLSLTFAKDAGKVYVYAIDNSEKGYRLYTEIVVPTEDISMGGFTMKIDSINWSCYGMYECLANVQTEVRMSMYAKEFKPIVIKEFDKNHKVVKETTISSLSEAPNFFMTQDGVRYVRVVEHGWALRDFAVGDTFTTKYPTKHRWMIEKTIQFI